ncbi:MAG TPA: replication-relaxation family protein [Solirubrobacterales bacterium]|nr:replication-relaxation family protein [Solirubrobacterales bacterium]
MTAVDHALPRLDPTAVAILESVNQHRLLSTAQVHELHMPAASRRWAQHQLARLRETGLAASVTLPGRRLLWHLTERGVDAAETIPDRAETRRKAIAPEHAAGPLQEHTIAVNEVGLAFVRAARERGDECGPFDWLHEVAHSLGPPPGRRAPEQLISDAVLTYQLAEGEGRASIAYRFVELDRANRSAAELARRIGRYGRLHRRTIPAEDSTGEPVVLWERLYPVFPTVLVVLAGRARDRLEDRRGTLLALCRQDPDLSEAPEVEVSICLLDDLAERGPFAPICRTLADPGKAVDWLGEEVG